jgi:hypothetical protein
VIETMGNALTNIGNGSLEPAPVARWADSKHFTAPAAPVPGKPHRAMAFIKPGPHEPMSPQPGAALGAHGSLRPLIPAPQLNETLDYNGNEQYQWNALCGFYPLCQGGKSDRNTLSPFPTNLIHSFRTVDIN